MNSVRRIVVLGWVFLGISAAAHADDRLAQKAIEQYRFRFATGSQAPPETQAPTGAGALWLAEAAEFAQASERPARPPIPRPPRRRRCPA